MIRLLPIVLLALAAATRAQGPTEVALPAGDGWHAREIWRAEAGTWYVRVAPFVPGHAAPDVIATDDRGAVHVLSGYSGRWSARSVNCDGQWLAPALPADVDPRVPGDEIYVAGKAGNVHRVRLVPKPFGKFELDTVEIGHAAGEEFHCVLAADLLPARPGAELLAFAISGAVYELRPEPGGEAGAHAFAMREIARLPGRVRDAVVLPAAPGEAPTIVAASRSGHLLALRLDEGSLAHRAIAIESSGLGRVATRRGRPGEPAVVYATRDDGVVLRLQHAPQNGGGWHRAAIFAGEQGLRGVVAADLFADGREALAVHGYDGKVQVVSRVRGGDAEWAVETVFRSKDAGHWLAAGELDGRNGTDELVASGFGGQVVLLSRPVGYALDGAAIDVDARPPAGRPREDRPLRVAVRAGPEALRELSPLVYQGGFETKTLVYETLVRRGPDGRIAPGLATAWTFGDDGRSVTFTLRPGATFHDGTPVTAAAAAMHFRRWVGLPEHDWLPSNARIQRVAAVGERELRIDLDRPAALLPDLCAINPTAIRGPGALDREGRFVRPVGSGPFRVVDSREDGRILRLQAHRPGAARFVDLVRLADGEDPCDLVLRGEVDAVVSGWLVRIDPERAARLRDDPRLQVADGPGSLLRVLRFATDGPAASLALRRRIAVAVDRAHLVAAVEHGLADAATTAMAPSIAIWPQRTDPADGPARGAVAAPAGSPGPVAAGGGGPGDAAIDVAPGAPLRLSVARGDAHLRRLADAIAAQLAARDLPAVVVDAGAWDLRIDQTYGVPYDPFATVRSWLGDAPSGTAATARPLGGSARVRELAAAVAAAPDEVARTQLYAAIQRCIDDECLLVPLYAPRRIAIVRAGLPLPRLDHDEYRLDDEWLLRCCEQQAR